MGMLPYKPLEVRYSISSQFFISGNWGSAIIKAGKFLFVSQYMAEHPSGAVTTW
jgi:hypothetical protein